jgi:AraC-like DNA-binding protein
MALMVSTDLIDSQSRVEALATAMSQTEVPIDVTVSGPSNKVWHRLEAWELQPGFHVLRNVGTSFRVRRGPVQLKVAAPERVAVAFQMGAAARYESVAGLQMLKTKDMQLVDQTSAMDYSFSGVGGSTAAIFDYDTIGVSVDTARKAIPSLRRSPLYELVRTDFSRLCETLDGLQAGPAIDLVASSMKKLIAALIVTAAADSAQYMSEAMEDTIVSRVKAYIDLHLSDPTLSANAIAAAHHISPRHLQDVWPRAETSVGQYMTEQRLARAERLMRVGPAAPERLQEISRESGFSSTDEFMAEFQNSYGMAAKQWHAFGSSAGHTP